MLSELPSGTVTFLFTDIESSTRIWEEHPASMAAAVERHETVLRQAIAQYGGRVFKTMGDAVCSAFSTAPGAVKAAIQAQHIFAEEDWGQREPLRVRIALHTGTAEARDDDYFGAPVNRVGRLVSAAHGGQILLSLACEELVREQLPDAAALIDLGQHRLRDLTRPERIFQVSHPDIPSQFPPLRTLDSRPNNLPVQRTPLIGREAEVQEIRRLLARTEGGLVTLTGPGGTGKTRLGLQVGAELVDEFEHGVYYVALGTTRDSQLVGAEVARALALRTEGNESPLEALRDHLRKKQVLLILDNFEQVVAAADVVSAILAGCPQVKLLVTSRAVLRVSGERECQVRPLAIPDFRRSLTAAEATGFPAVDLFVLRAQAAQPDFRLTDANARAIAEICARLDGLPLAIELAAARVKMLPPEAMLARMDNRLRLLTRGARDLPDRQQTLRGAISWGYDLLSEDEKGVFRMLSVFSGGFTLPMAHAVCDPEGEMDLELLDGVASLVDKSFLRHDQPDGVSRFTMLETIREFGLEELANAGSAADLLQRHAEYFVRMATDAELGLRGPQQHQWLDRLEREHDNLRAALAWTEANPEQSEIAWRLAGGLWRFWFLRDYIEEGRKTLDRLIRSDAPGSPAARAKAIAGAAFLAYFQGQAADAGRFFQESTRLSDEVGDMWCLAFSLCGIGSTSQARGDHNRAKIALQRGLNLARKVQDPWLIGIALTSHWSTIVHFGEFKDAEPMFRECLEHCRAAGDPSLTCWPLMILGVIDLMTGKAETAGPYFTEALECARRVGNKQSMSSSLESLAHTWILTGRIEDGARLLGAGEAARDASGTPRQPYGVPLYEGLLAHLREQLGPERAGELLQAGRAIPVDEAIKIALGESEFGE